MGHLFINYLWEDPKLFFAVVITVVVSVTLHELAHGWVAIRLGDNTPIYTGHMTLNPVVHMGVFSLVLLAVAGIAFGQMPVDRTRLRGKYGESLVAVAGPVTNLLLGLLGALGLGLWARFGTINNQSQPQLNAYLLLSIFMTFNFALAVFNILPVPPLDGSWIAANFFPPYRRFLQTEMVRGLMSALIFAMILGGSSFVFLIANKISDTLVGVIAGPNLQQFVMSVSP